MTLPFSKHINWLGTIAILFLVLSCKKDEPVIEAGEARTIMDHSYGDHPKQKMDIYLPADRSTDKTKVLVILHGGGFLAGDKSDFGQPIITYALSQGWAVVNASYRLVNDANLLEIPPKRVNSEIKVKNQVSDIARVVDYILINSREWAVNGHKIGLAGHSAGGSLALLYAYDSRNDGKVKAVSNWAGALDLAFNEADLASLGIFVPLMLEIGHRFTGFEFTAANISHYEEISPMYVANTQRRIHTLNIFPENNILRLFELGDFTIDLPKQDRSTYDAFTVRLNQLGVTNKFIQIDGADHGFGGGAWTGVITETLSYFDEVM